MIAELHNIFTTFNTDLASWIGNFNPFGFAQELADLAHAGTSEFISNVAAFF